MSTIRVDNFAPSAGGTSFGIIGIAKALVRFDGASTGAAIFSENVSSITDNGTGDYTITVTNAFADADHHCLSSGTQEPATAAGAIVGAYPATASTYEVDVRNTNNSQGDYDNVMMAAFGDLA